MATSKYHREPLIRLVRRTIPDIIAKELIDVQPMSGEAGLIFLPWIWCTPPLYMETVVKVSSNSIWQGCFFHRRQKTFYYDGFQLKKVVET